MTFHEILHIRNSSHVTFSEMSLFSGSNCKVGFHLVCIPFVTEIVGLHLSATGSSYSDALPPANTKARFWLMTRHVQTYLPEFLIPGSDTKYANSTDDYAVQVGNDSGLTANSSCAGGDYSLDFFYPNPIPITQPDYYYIGIAIQSAGDGRFRASHTANNPLGIADLEYVNTGPLNASILSWGIPQEIPYYDLQSSSDPVLCNLNVCLFTQQPSDVPYLRPGRL